MKKIVALIPARSGSKGVPNKNIRFLGGHTLIEWAVKSCQKSFLIDDVYVSTDSEYYASEAIKYGAKAPFLRPKNISQDSSTDYEMVLHAIDWLRDHEEEPELIVHIRPTSPLRQSNVIEQAIKTFLGNSEATSLRSVHLMSESAYKTFEISNEGNLVQIFSKKNNIDLSNVPRQSFPDTFIANGYVDVLSTKFIRESESIHGNFVIPFQTDITPEIDNEDDFSFLNYLITENPNIINQLFD